MTNIDTGTQGAKRQSYRKASPRELLKRLMDDNSKSSEHAIQKKFAAAVRDDDDYLDAIIEYWFANNYRSLVHKDPVVAKKSATERAALVEAVKEKIVVAATKMVLLDITMPNGKPLRDCTGKECAKAGGWLSKIAKAIKPTDRVGAALSEEQVRKFYGR